MPRLSPGLAFPLALAACGAADTAQARECHATVLRQVTDDIGNVWRPGTSLPVDIARAGPDGGAFCAHGGGCEPRRTDGAPALRLVGCRVGPSIGNGDRRLVPGSPRR